MNRLATIAAFALSLAPATALAATWTAGPADSRLGFVGKQGGTAFEGRFKSWSASITFDPTAPESGKAVVTIDMASASTGDPQKDGALPQPDWFNAGKVPQARFEATSFRAKGGNAYEAVGTLTIRDVSKPVVLPFTLDIQGDTAKAKGKLDIIRTDYGVGQGPWASGQAVALEVSVVVDITAKKGG